MSGDVEADSYSFSSEESIDRRSLNPDTEHCPVRSPVGTARGGIISVPFKHISPRLPICVAAWLCISEPGEDGGFKSTAT